MKKQKAIEPIDFHTEPQQKKRVVKFPNSIRINFSCREEIFFYWKNEINCEDKITDPQTVLDVDFKRTYS